MSDNCGDGKRNTGIVHFFASCFLLSNDLLRLEMRILVAIMENIY